MSVPYAAGTSDRYECDDDILADAPENPVRFLDTANADFVWKGMIDGIDDPDRLEAYRQAEKRHIEGRYDKTAVHKHIDARERELTAEETSGPLPIPRAIVPLADFEAPAPSPTPETTTNPVAATDGGTALTEPDETADTPEPDELHPDTKGLAVGEVLELETADRTEYIFPSTAAAETPYLLRAFDGDDERTDAPIGLSFDEVAKRIDGEHDPKSVGEIDMRAPELAASNGGDSQ